MNVTDTAQTAGGVVAGLGFIAAVVLLVLFLVPSAVGAEASYVVLSDSMSPTIDAGDVVVVQSTAPEAITENEVITYRTTRQGGPNRVTHRVVAIQETESGVQFRTKGDANENPDPELVPAEAVIGTLWFTVPLVGHLFVFAGTDLGLVALVIVPAVLLVLNELYTLLNGDETDDREEHPG